MVQAGNKAKCLSLVNHTTKTNPSSSSSSDTITFKFVSNTCRCYLKEIFELTSHCRIDTRNKFGKLKIPFCKTNMGKKVISLVGPSLRNSLLELIRKKTDNLNTFKYNIKKYSLN